MRRQLAFGARAAASAERWWRTPIRPYSARSLRAWWRKHRPRIGSPPQRIGTQPDGREAQSGANASSRSATRSGRVGWRAERSTTAEVGTSPEGAAAAARRRPGAPMRARGPAGRSAARPARVARESAGDKETRSPPPRIGHTSGVTRAPQSNTRCAWPVEDARHPQRLSQLSAPMKSPAARTGADANARWPL